MSNRLNTSSDVLTYGNFSNNYQRYFDGCRPLALAVSVRSKNEALVRAPSGITLNNQFFLPIVERMITDVFFPAVFCLANTTLLPRSNIILPFRFPDPIS